MQLTRRLKAYVNQLLGRRGYQIGRMHVEAPINLLDLAISHLVLGRENTTFVQVGANDGKRNDPLAAAIARFGLRGVMVEPQPGIFSDLEANIAGRPGIQAVHAAIDWADGERSMFRFSEDADVPDWARGLCSFDRSHLLKFAELRGSLRQIEEVRVKTLSVPVLLAMTGIDEVGILQVDTEGYDFEVLKMFFGIGVFPRVINYEHCNLSGQEKLQCEGMLRERSYQYVRYGLDTLALRQSS